MIRPVTIATFLMACGSGLYLYQSKHEVQLLDRTIERTVHDTATLREQSRLLVAEWTMLNDPERLRQLSDTYLNLRPIAPTQFTSLADLENRLPPPQIEPPPSAPEPEKLPVAASPEPLDAAPAASEPTGPVVADAEEDLPVPPMPATHVAPGAAVVVAAVRPPPPKPQPPKPVVAEVPPPRSLATADVKPPERRTLELPQRAVAAADIKPVERHTLEQPQRTVAAAEVKPVEHHTLEQRPVRTAEVRPLETRPAEVMHASVAPLPKPQPAPQAPRPMQLSPPPSNLAVAAPYGGSLLGMARGSAPPAPRPVPVNATQW